MGPTDDQAARHGPRSNDASIYCSQSCNPVQALCIETRYSYYVARGIREFGLETCTIHAEELLKTVTAHITRHMGNGYWAIGQAEPELWLMATQAIPVSRYCDCLVHTFRRIPMPPWVTHVKPCHVKGMICLLYCHRIAVNSA